MRPCDATAHIKSASRREMASVSQQLSPSHQDNPNIHFKMKSFVVFALLVAAAVAAPANPDADAQVLRYDADNIGVDGYRYAYETSNGIKQEEQAQLQNAGSENEAISVRGSYSYTGPDGVVYTVTYIADENGFQPQGAHLPQAP